MGNIHAVELMLNIEEEDKLLTWTLKKYLRSFLTRRSYLREYICHHFFPKITIMMPNILRKAQVRKPAKNQYTSGTYMVMIQGVDEDSYVCNCK